MELFDSHAHYNDEQFNIDRETLLDDIYKYGVTKFVSAGYDLESSKKGLQLANEKQYIYTTLGISPNDVKSTIEETEKDIADIEKILEQETKKENKKIVAVGEIGLDYHWNDNNKEIQKYTFIQQIKLANKYGLPIVIHTREAVMDTISILKENINLKKGIFHCCPLNRELVKEALKLGYYISFAGPITFKNSKNADEIIQMVPEERILIETDSPYLSPEPHRGTRNDSRNVIYMVNKIATVRGKSVDYIAEITYKNAENIFNIKNRD